MNYPIKQEIDMNKQKNIIPQKEGILSYLSYLGCSLTVIFSFVLIYYFGKSPYNFIKTSYLLSFFIGLILTIITMVKSKYPISAKIKKILLIVFVLSTLIFELISFWILTYEDSCNNSLCYLAHISPEGGFIFKNIAWFIGWIFLFSFGWYNHYFYKKAKDGYQWVLLKIILFTLISLLLIYHQRSINEYGSIFEVYPSIKTYKDVENHYLTNEFLQQMKKMQIPNNK